MMISVEQKKFHQHWDILPRNPGSNITNLVLLLANFTNPACPTTNMKENNYMRDDGSCMTVRQVQEQYRKQNNRIYRRV